MRSISSRWSRTPNRLDDLFSQCNNSFHRRTLRPRQPPLPLSSCAPRRYRRFPLCLAHEPARGTSKASARQHPHPRPPPSSRPSCSSTPSAAPLPSSSTWLPGLAPPEAASTSLSAGLRHDKFAFPFALRSCAALSDLRLGNCCSNDLFMAAALVDMYSKCAARDVFCARQMFDKMASRDLVCWTSMIAGYAHHGDAGLLPAHATVEREAQPGHLVELTPCLRPSWGGS
ncbi:hypothetical protein B296_00031382 [Ensete ventricosum]|uniref:Pentatricopeptide repeat-containing protein n=1 Tax=Ensete ventricosum TaxID=4639 RepID=A0A426X9Q4_ENSVE|nr:hypothetical protein B296_00031382 [Ensete ventricosum]